jgi:hypothetical protein
MVEPKVPDGGKGLAVGDLLGKRQCQSSPESFIPSIELTKAQNVPVKAPPTQSYPEQSPA